KVVNDIRFCAGRMDVNFIGCTGNTVALEDVSDTGSSSPPDPGVDGILWAHEFGHATGLQDQPANRDFIMSATISPSNTFLTQPECTNYLINDQINIPFDTNPQFFPGPPESAAAGSAAPAEAAP